MQFIARRLLNKNINLEIEKIGFDSSYLDFAALKHDFLTLKIYNLKPEAATIIKQTSLASGTDTAVNRGVLNCSIENSSAILSGSLKELKNIADKLKLQPFSLSKISEEILKQINIAQNEQKIPKIMGILNITEDSFSDGGKFFETKDAIRHAQNMIKEGVSIIDIGAESTRPGADTVACGTETERLLPVVEYIKKNHKDITVSIDTRNAGTAKCMIEKGADIINDVSGFSYDKNMARVIKESGKKVVIMHSRGTPGNMDTMCNYNDVVEDVYIELYEKVHKAIDLGIKQENIIIDPGFGFAKNNEQNFEILKRIKEFKSIGCELLIGLSRKRFIKSIDSSLSEEETDNLTAQANMYASLNGVDIIRVHNIRKTKTMLAMANAISL